MGNREYCSGYPHRLSKTLEKDANIKVLNDDFVEFENFILVGRENPTKKIFGEKRKELKIFLKKILINIILQ